MGPDPYDTRDAAEGADVAEILAYCLSSAHRVVSLHASWVLRARVEQKDQGQ